jgi:hypothetical protein
MATKIGLKRFTITLLYSVLLIGCGYLVAVVVPWHDWLSRVSAYLPAVVDGSSDGSKSLVTSILVGIVLAIAGPLFVFFIIERWRRMESEISEVRRMNDDIGQKLERKVSGYLEDKTRKLDAMDNHLRKLLEDHPWIAGLTENNFIPKVPSCRAVLSTAIELHDQGKDALVYEFLFGWLKKTDRVPRLEGTLDDFFDLIRFCERELCDEYLCVLILRAVAVEHESGGRVLPEYVRRLLRSGDYAAAKRAANLLRRIVERPWWLMWSTVDPIV